MFKKLKAEFKAALKIGKSRSKEDNRQLLTVDGSGDDSKAPAGLSRPHGLRGSLDMSRPAGFASSGEARPGYVSESGMVSRDVNNATCVIPASSNVTNVDPASNEAQRQGDPSAAPVEQPQQLQQHKHRPQHHQEQLQALQHEQQDCTQQQQQQQHGQQTNSTPASPRTPRAQQQADAADAGAAATHQASDPPAAAGATGNAGTSGSDKQQRPSGRTGRHSEARAAAAAEAVARAETAANSKYPEPSRTPRDEDLGSCPPYATKAVWGLRYTMEDKWAAVPNLIQLPVVLTQPQKKSAAGKASGCGCMIKPSKVLAKVSPSGRADKSQDRVPLIAHHGSDMLLPQHEPGSTSSSSSASAAAAAAAASAGSLPELDSLHYFGVFDGHGGADAARHCAQRMHQVVSDTIRSMLCPEAASAAEGAAATASSSTPRDAAASSDAAADPQQQQQQLQQKQLLDQHEQQHEQLQVQSPEQEQQQQQQARPAEAPAAAGAAAAGDQLPPSSSAAADDTSQAPGTNIITAANVSPASMASLTASNGNWLLLALSKSFVSLDSEFGVLSEGSYVGSTAVVVLLGGARLWVAHAGDSRAILGRKGVAVVLTSDHKASRDDEVQRVQAAGGHVWWDRVMGELAVSRAIGDHCLRPYVIPEPEVLMVERTKDDEVLVMASDGLWDVIGNQEAADMAVHSLQAAEASGHSGVGAAKRAATSLTKAALERGTRDNVTVLVVDLRGRSGGLGASSSSSTSNHSSSRASGEGKPREKKSRSSKHHSLSSAAAGAEAAPAVAEGAHRAVVKQHKAKDGALLASEQDHSSSAEASKAEREAV